MVADNDDFGPDFPEEYEGVVRKIHETLESLPDENKARFMEILLQEWLKKMKAAAKTDSDLESLRFTERQMKHMVERLYRKFGS